MRNRLDFKSLALGLVLVASPGFGQRSEEGPDAHDQAELANSEDRRDQDTCVELDADDPEDLKRLIDLDDALDAKVKKTGRSWFENKRLDELGITISSDCAYEVFHKLLDTRGLRDWGKQTFVEATRVKTTFARDAFFYLIEKTGTISWAPYVFRTAAEMGTAKKRDLFFETLDHAKIRDFPEGAYVTLLRLRNDDQRDLYRMMITNRSPFNYRGEDFKAILEIKRVNGKDHPKQAFQALLEAKPRLNWPLAAYQHAADVNSPANVAAYKRIVTNYNVLSTLMTQTVERVFLVKQFGASLFLFIQRTFGGNAFDNLRKMEEVAQEYRVGGTVGALTLIYQLMKLSTEEGRRRLTLGIEKLVTLLGSAAERADEHKVNIATAVAAWVAANVLYSVYHSVTGAKSDADIVFFTAANLKNEHGLKAFDDLIQKVKFKDWSSRVYISSLAIETARQQKRFSKLVANTGRVPFSVMAYEVAASLDLGEGAEVAGRRRGEKVSVGERAFDHLIERAKNFYYQDWPDEVYATTWLLESPMALDTFIRLTSKDYDSKAASKGVFGNFEIPQALAKVRNDFQRQAIFELVDDSVVWKPEMYREAVATSLSSEGGLSAFRRKMRVERLQQGKPSSMIAENGEGMAMTLSSLLGLVNLLGMTAEAERREQASRGVSEGDDYSSDGDTAGRRHLHQRRGDESDDVNDDQQWTAWVSGASMSEVLKVAKALRNRDMPEARTISPGLFNTLDLGETTVGELTLGELLIAEDIRVKGGQERLPFPDGFASLLEDQGLEGTVVKADGGTSIELGSGDVIMTPASLNFRKD